MCSTPSGRHATREQRRDLGGRCPRRTLQHHRVTGDYDENRCPLQPRALAGQTQVSAMMAQQPTLVSVELAANDVLPASTGRISAMTPYADWERDYDQVLAAVQSTGARGVLVGLPTNAANFPSIRRARELFNEWPSLLALGISVSLNCYFSSNYIFVPGYVLTLLSKSPMKATCADVPGAAVYVLAGSELHGFTGGIAQ